MERGTRNERKAEAVGGRVQRLVSLLLMTEKCRNFVGHPAFLGLGGSLRLAKTKEWRIARSRQVQFGRTRQANIWPRLLEVGKQSTFY